MTEQKNQLAGGIIGLLVVVGAAWYLFGGGLEKQAAKDLDNIQQQVAADFVNQYEIAKRSGTAIDAHLHAGLAAAAYLQAGDESNYRKWKEIEKREARRAGLPAE